MPLTLPFNGMTPLLFHVVLDAFKLWHASVERKVLVESFELCREVSLLIASVPVAVSLQPFGGALQEFPTAFLRRNADNREFPLRVDPTDVLEAQELKGAWLAAV